MRDGSSGWGSSLQLPGAVVGGGDGDLGGVGVVAGGAGCDQVVQPVSEEVGRRLADEGRLHARKVGAVVAGHVGVVGGEVGADELGVDPLEVVVRLAVGGFHDEVEVAGVHPQRFQVGLDPPVGAQDRVSNEHGRALLDPRHDLDPADEGVGGRVVDDVRPIHPASWMQRRGWIVGFRRDDQALVGPVVEIGGGVAAHAPVPDP